MALKRQAYILLCVMVLLTCIQLHWNWHRYAVGFVTFLPVCKGLLMLAAHALHIPWGG